MLRRIGFVARKDFQYYWLDWESYVWALAVPVLFMYFIGTVMGGFGGSDPSGSRTQSMCAPTRAKIATIPIGISVMAASRFRRFAASF